jgi:non-specific serine/threonine protein kinase
VSDASRVDDLVSTLVEHNLVTPTDTPDDEEPRIEMAGVIRELALERLAASNEDAATRDAHAAVFLALALEGETHMVGGVETAWLDLLEREHANFRAALAWTLRDDAGLERATRGAQLAGALWLFWYYHSHLTEGRAWLERALAMPGIPDLARGRLQLGLGTIMHFLGEPQRAREVLVDGLRVLLDVGDLTGAAYALSGIGTIAEDIGLYAEAAEAFTEANALFRRLDDSVNIAVTQHHLGVVALGQGDLPLAIERLEGSLALARRERDPWSTAASLSYLGLVRGSSGDVEGAADALREALALYRELGTTERTVGTIRRVAVLAVTRRDLPTAVRLFAATDALAADLGIIQALPEREIYDRALADAERRLPAARRETEATRGTQLSLEEALADAERLVETVDRRRVVTPERPDATGLSPREREVLRLLVDGASNDEIAAALNVSRRTAAQHVGSILGKLGASNRTAATTIALRRGLV